MGSNVFQTLYCSFKQEKFANEQSKLSGTDVKSRFANLKKSSLGVPMKLVQSFKIVGLTNTRI